MGGEKRNFVTERGKTQKEVKLLVTFLVVITVTFVIFAKIVINFYFNLLEITILFIFYFYFYIYPPDSQESEGGAIHRVSNYPDLLPEMPRYCCQ